MKIGTYNLDFLFDEGTHMYAGKEYHFSFEFTEKRIEYFAKEFARINADILFLQELGSERVLQEILKKIPVKYSYFIATPDQNGVGNAVIFKDETSVCESIPAKTSLPVFVEGDEDTIGARMWSRRDFIHLKTTYAGAPLHLIGVHIKANFPIPQKTPDGTPKQAHTQLEAADDVIRSEMFRFSQARKVREMVDHMYASPETQLIVLGDFNAQNTNKVFEIIRGPKKEEGGFLYDAAGSVPVDKRFSMVGKEYSSQIDHMLVSKPLIGTVRNCTMENERLFNHSAHQDFPYIVESDHAPFTIELA